LYDHFSADDKKIYKEINSLVEDSNFFKNRDKEGMLERTKIENEGKLKETLIKIITLSSEYYFFDLDISNTKPENYKLDSSKNIIFWNNLILPFEVITNRNNSTIKVEVVN
jgi:hypothetical protein